MKYFSKPILIFLVMFILAVPVFALDITLKNLQSNVDSFSEEMSKALPFNSTMGLNWSDAYIGNFPSFGIGLSAGLTTMDSKSIDSMTSLFGMPKVIDLPLVSSIGFPLPAYTVDARIGIPALPIDFGIKFGYLNESWLEPLLGIGIKNMLIGADVRYAVMNSKVIPMRLSVGLGFNYLDGGISKKFSETIQFSDFDNGIGFNTVDPQVDIMWKTTNVEFKMQVSFPYKILTPYAGAGVSYAWSQAGYKISSSLDLSGLTDAQKDILLQQLNLTNVTDKGLETVNKVNGINTRVFGGLSFNLAYIRLDLTGMYEIMNRNFGASFGLRFQM